MTQANDCNNCRHHQKQPRAKPTGWQSGAHFELADENQTVYRCGAPEGPAAPHAGKEVGLLPIFCESHEAGKTEKLPETMGAAYESWQKRMAARAEKEKREADG